jgi:hypothetical protein
LKSCSIGRLIGAGRMNDGEPVHGARGWAGLPRVETAQSRYAHLWLFRRKSQPLRGRAGELTSLGILGPERTAALIHCAIGDSASTLAVLHSIFYPICKWSNAKSGRASRTRTAGPWDRWCPRSEKRGRGGPTSRSGDVLTTRDPCGSWSRVLITARVAAARLTRYSVNQAGADSNGPLGRAREH